jgi:phosphatidylglycerophosphate synthase
MGDNYPAVLFYPANIIDYFRVLFLWLALGGFDGFAYASSGGPALFARLGLPYTEGRCFAALYAFSYFLDCFDGIVARALNQCSKLGYYLDMIIDRVSSTMALWMAARLVRSGAFPLDGPLTFLSAAGLTAESASFLLIASAIFVEIVAHGIVCYYAEACGVHQKLLGHNFAVVRLYLDVRGRTHFFFALSTCFGAWLRRPLYRF